RRKKRAKPSASVHGPLAATACELFVSAELSKRGIPNALLPENFSDDDILLGDKEGQRVGFIQVKACHPDRSKSFILQDIIRFIHGPAYIYRNSIVTIYYLEGESLSSPGPCTLFEATEAFRAPMDQIPPSTEIRKSSEHSIAKSVRASLTMYQNPWLARDSSGIFVLTIAVVITISSGIAAARVHTPSRTNRPHAISNVPTKCAVKYGCGNPIFVKRTTPMLGSMYLRMPCVKKINPTARRMNRMLAGPCLDLGKNQCSEFIWNFHFDFPADQ